MIGGVPRHSRNGRGGQSTRQEPQKVPATALDGVLGVAIPLMEFMVGEVGNEVDTFWHASVLQHLPAMRDEIGRQGWGIAHRPEVLADDQGLASTRWNTAR